MKRHKTKEHVGRDEHNGYREGMRVGLVPTRSSIRPLRRGGRAREFWLCEHQTIGLCHRRTEHCTLTHRLDYSTGGPMRRHPRQNTG